MLGFLRGKGRGAVIALAAVLLVSLAVGTTYAIFSNSNPNINAPVRISAGELKMDLLLADESGNYSSIASGEGDIFDSSAMWTPGQTRVVYFKIQNKGEIPVKYLFRFSTELEGLEGAFEYCAFAAEFGEVASTDWATVSGGRSVSELVNGYNSLSGADYTALDAGDEDYYAVALHMRSVGGNDYQNKSCLIDVNVYAVQANAD